MGGLNTNRQKNTKPGVGAMRDGRTAGKRETQAMEVGGKTSV